MNRKTFLALCAAGGAAIIAAGIFLDGNENAVSASSMAATSSMAGSVGASSAESGIRLAPVLTPIEVPDPSNVGVSGYLDRVMYDGSKRADIMEKTLAGYNLTPYLSATGNEVTLATGHKVYVKADETDGQQYVVSGFELLPVNNGIIDTKMSVKLRKEKTAERVRIFSTQADYDTATQNYEYGQQILGGYADVPEHCIILNGSFVPVQYTVGTDGTIYVPMTKVAEAYDEGSEYYDVEGWLNVALDLRYVMIPTANTTGEVLDLFGSDGKQWRFDNDSAPMWSDYFYLPTTADTEMPIEDVARIFGWSISTGDNIVSIVTDKLDNNNNFVLQETSTTTEIYSYDGTLDSGSQELTTGGDTLNE